MDQIVTELAPAKLNLALSVGPPTSAGLHAVCSWMVTVDLVDELEVRALPSGSLSRYAILWHEDARRRSDIDWSVRSDLAVRAHLALQQHAGTQLPVQLKVEKRIPVGGGLGGGSSNAAATLRAVNRLFELGLTMDELARIGATIGSDVSFLVTGGSALVQGVGEQIVCDAELPDLHAVVVHPAQSCPTANVYGRFDERIGGAAVLRADDIERLRTMTSPQQLAGSLFNDLADAAIDVAPQLREHLDNLREIAERPAHITGSGSSLFIICDDSVHAEALAGAIEQQLNLPAVAVKLYEPAHEPTAH